MEGFSKKIYLQPNMPDAAISDQARLCQTLEAMGYAPVTVSLRALQALYPLYREQGITVTLIHRDRDWVVTDVEAGDTCQQHYGLAVDYGSTTIVMQLVDMHSGAIIGEEKAVNGQTVYGTDILTRITYALEDPFHPEELQRVTAETFGLLLEQLTASTGIDAAKCPMMIVSGNTCMIHFLLKLNAWTVFASPYAPVTMEPGFFEGGQLRLPYDGMVYIVPAASNYIGGDIISGLLVLDIHKQDKTCLFFDIGTNGELVIGNKEWIMAGAGAAGPALEGYISRFGMRAADGAIDSVKISGEQLTFTTIAGQKPVGICGSGIIDLLAQMRLNGWINIAGTLEPAASGRIIWLDDEQQYAAVYALAEESAGGQPLYFSQQDIMQYLDTKAAAYTMVECLLETAGVSLEELATLHLSGAFPAHSDLESAITIGIFPDLPREKFSVVRNTSLDGARILLLNRSRLEEAQALAQSIYCLQFASVPDFLIRMQAAKFIPHTDMRRYPSIQARLAKQ